MLGHRDNKRNHYSFYLTRKQRSTVYKVFTHWPSHLLVLCRSWVFCLFFSSSKFTISVMLTRASR